MPQYETYHCESDTYIYYWLMNLGEMDTANYNMDKLYLNSGFPRLISVIRWPKNVVIETHEATKSNIDRFLSFFKPIY